MCVFSSFHRESLETDIPKVMSTPPVQILAANTTLHETETQHDPGLGQRKNKIHVDYLVTEGKEVLEE